MEKENKFQELKEPGKIFSFLDPLLAQSPLFVGIITLGDILEILPFEDSILVLELDGQTIWDAFEAGLYTWPAQEG